MKLRIPNRPAVLRGAPSAFSLISTICLAACSSGTPQDDVDAVGAAVIAGNPVDPNGSGYVIFGGCSGTLMSNSWVLTARHCVGQADVGSPSFLVRMGTQSAAVTEVIQYPYDDVALLRLGTPLAMNGSTSGYELRLYPRRTGTLTPSTPLVCSGYGDNDVSGHGFGTLRSATLPVRGVNFTWWFQHYDLAVNENSSGQSLAPGDSGGSCLAQLPSGERVLAGVTVTRYHELDGTFNGLVDADAFRTWYANVRATHAVLSAATSKCLDNDLNTRSRAQQWSCLDSANQGWRLVPHGNNWYEIRVQDTGQCLAGSTGPLSVRACDGSSAVLWSLANVSGDNYEIRSGASGQCVDIPSGSTSNGLTLQTYPCNGGPNQHWRFDTRFDPMFQSLTPTGGASCLDVQGGGTNANAPLQMYGCSGGDNQQWSLRRLNQAAHAAHPRQAQAMCADVPSASTLEFVQLQQYPCNTGSNQIFDAHWHNDAYSLVVRNSGLCLSTWAQGATTNGTQVQQVHCSAPGYQQLWTLY